MDFTDAVIVFLILSFLHKHYAYCETTQMKYQDKVTFQNCLPALIGVSVEIHMHLSILKVTCRQFKVALVIYDVSL